jgi:hypothetical protein
MANNEGLSTLHFVIVLELDLFEKEVGECTHEGMRLRGEHGLDMAKLLCRSRMRFKT